MITSRPNTNTTISVKTLNKSRLGPTTAHISIKEFLNYVKTAYQVQDSVEGILTSEGMTEAVNWLKKKENQQLLKENSISCQTSSLELVDSGEIKKDADHTSVATFDSEILKTELSSVLSDGLLDSVLPFLTQSTTALKKGSYIRLTEKPYHSSQTLPTHTEKVRRMSHENGVVAMKHKTDSEVEICVCDEVRGTKQTFICSQMLLVEKMGYFAEVTKGQCLEDMDISVHCDIGIFEWLMQWVKKDSLLEEDWPQLDPQCVIPVLVSADFLQMEPLVNDCLLFCHRHMNEILRTNSNLSCLNDAILTRLAAMYTNVEVESIKDRKDKIQSRLFSKLIISLCEPEPESVRGHWCSLATVFMCEKCCQLFTPAVALKVQCVSSCMRLQPDGSVINLHIRDMNWNINEYIQRLHKRLRTWRKVYWRLWGDAHFFACTTCDRYFPASQAGWCRHHPDAPQFFTLDSQRAPLPIGRYPCCGERAYRFQLLDSGSGCQFRQHTVGTNDLKESAAYALLETYRHLIEQQAPQLLFPERLTRLVPRDTVFTNNGEKKFVCKETFWWDGIEIIPPRPKLGLLGSFSRRMEGAESSTESSEECSEDESNSSSSSDSADESEESGSMPKKVIPRKRKVPKKDASKLWQHNLSARHNQDVQRAYEEHAVREMTAMLNVNTGHDTVVRTSKQSTSASAPVGGVWVRLEAEWSAHLAHNGQSKIGRVPMFLPGKSNKSRLKF